MQLPGAMEMPVGIRGEVEPPRKLSYTRSLSIPELQISRNCGPLFEVAFISQVLVAANTHVAGLWGGRHRGLLSLLVSATIYNGTKSISDDTFAHSGWGQYRGTNPARKIAAVGDLQASPSSFRLLARELGVWPVTPFGTQFDMRLGRIAHLRRLASQQSSP